MDRFVIASPRMNIGSHNHLYTFEKEGARFSCIVARLEEWQAYSRGTHNQLAADHNYDICAIIEDNAHINTDRL